MGHYRTDDTIAAISTPLGRSGIGIVRMSGLSALQIADKIFTSQDKGKVINFQSHTLHHGFIFKGADIVDEVLLTVMRAPQTYTRQDIVEINCHSGIVVLRKVLELCIQNGARLAEPGEFTLRAFLNGRIDLPQAEAVLNIIDAKTEESLQVAARQLKGALSGVLNDTREELISIVSEFEALLDFPEEEIEENRKENVLRKLKKINGKLADLLKHAKEGRLMQEGIKGVIVGKPNVGKSSLMNALLGHNRVIVTSVPGTTRDVVEEIIDLGGIPLRIADTAGIIETEDLVEKEGIKRAREQIEIADLVILVLDAASGIDKDDVFLFEQVKKKEHIICINKIDLKEDLDLGRIKKYGFQNIVKISAVKDKGIDELKDKIYELFLEEEIDFSIPIISSLRHQKAVENALESIGISMKNIKQGLYLELVAQDLKNALLEISRTLGKEATESVLDSIFSRFCIGK